MAVAVKNTPETAPAGLLDRMAWASLAGTVYAIGSLGIVFYLLPSLWWSLGWEGRNFLAVALLGILQLVAFVGLVVLGTRLLGPRAPTGVRAGIFVGLVGFLLLLLLTRWASMWIEYLSFDQGYFGPQTGAIATAAVGLVLLILGVRLFLRPATEKFLIRLENQGWFSATPYKPLQGLRVRRGTIFGILVLVGAGIWTMLSHGTLKKGSPDWALNIPFTAHVTVENVGDAEAAIKDKFHGWEPGIPLVVDRSTLQEINRTIDPSKQMKIVEPGASGYEVGHLVERAEFDATVKKLRDRKQTPPQATAPTPAGGPTTFATLTLLPGVQYTVPLLLLAMSLWLAWRIVNVPVFADFLIATDAEMNKVSWTTQRRLVQDTIVVLATVVLMAFFLFAMDQTWRVLLSWKPISVLVLPTEEQKETTTNVDQRPW
jgi:preprotein translocase SecE subunit